MDFQIKRNKLVDKLNLFIREYEEFTKEVSSQNWRTTGHHITSMKNFSSEMENLKQISEEEKNNDWVKEAIEKE